APAEGGFELPVRRGDLESTARAHGGRGRGHPVEVFLGGDIDVRLRVGARFQFSDLGRQRGDLGLEFGDLALLRRLRRSCETGGAERGGERCGEDRMAHEGFLGYAMSGAEATPTDGIFRIVAKPATSTAFPSDAGENGAAA